MMEDYTTEILIDSGYSETDSKNIANKLVMGYNTHEEVINFDKAKKLGLKVIEDTKYPKEWSTFRMWLGKYLLISADKHVIRYLLPTNEDMNKNQEVGQ
ncbi:MAG: hypothetical protein OIN66_12140 [Candidatus Methanoperedens sp.]|nr:hypothetical protein [Candidatus Methanoperedens sp.]